MPTRPTVSGAEPLTLRLVSEVTITKYGIINENLKNFNEMAETINEFVV